MKKLWIGSLSLAIAAVAVLSGCTDKAAGPQQDNAATAAKINPAGQFPIMKEKTTLKVLVKGSSFVEDFATNEYTKFLEEKTNIHIEWDIAPEKSAIEKLNLVLGSGDLPDVIMGFDISPTQQLIYGNTGEFLDLTKYIDQYGTETKKMFEKLPYVKEAITAPGGKIFGLPQVNECFHCSMSQKTWIYKPWLDKLGLQVPTTTDEFYNVLKAFKTQDPNGNGKADEIPLAGAAVGPNVNIDSFIMNAFILNPSIINGSEKRLFINNGKVTVAFDKPEFKDGLEYLHKLYAEGLIAPQSFTQDRDQAKQMGENPGTVILGAAVAQHDGIFTDSSKGNVGRWLDYVAVPALKGPKGVQVAPLNNSVNQGRLVITKASKNPEAAFRWADLMYDQEMTLRNTEGRPNVEWKLADPGEVGINGKPAIWKYTDVKLSTVQNVKWSQTGPSLRTNDFRLGLVPDPKLPQESILYNETKTKYEPYKQKDDTVLPQLFFTNEQATELADLDKTINDHVKEMIARFIIGDAKLDKDWDGYLKNLDNMKLKRYLEIYQAAYDAKKTKK
ncbi:MULTISPECIES: ABC transporter substrate-binding protein [Paenibacillus]|jgi:putative aldouronate transport system substrate-binding protein|uniref:ABC transporter substrate-binding protein n=1 Tax=Paenibacillus baimaensis TaxID=2982185 RepID=A0ABT2UPZ0_9BACL|nr:MULTISPECIES: ABC transporter substrate-binding protein [unclassified Paenibacillus]MCU6796723.1 ABC transporter substrate-binding protein [Paenibacillus sp. WQ 127069]OMF14894.1 ABC transporter substrate-binding protein [Paenibacillus sp. FSL H7-0331]